MKLICNSIPKSGTYLLAAIAQFCGYSDQKLRFVDNGTNVVDDDNNLVEFVTDSTPTRFTRLAENSYAPSHLTYSDQIATAMQASGIKQLFIYRHPGEVLYSYVRFVTYSRSFFEQSQYNAELQTRMKNEFSSDEARLLYVFANMKTAFNFVDNVRWLTSPACHPIRFEALYPELLDLQANRIGPVLKSIFTYVGFSAEKTGQQIYDGVYGQGPTFMEGRDKVHQFAKLNRDAMAPLIDNPEFQHVTTLLGYSA